MCVCAPAPLADTADEDILVSFCICPKSILLQYILQFVRFQVEVEICNKDISYH